jgi:aerobic carbon-monoxide dehydrogenase small subunit
VTDRTIAFRLNGEAVSATVPTDRFLVDLLRIDLGRTGTKLGCGIGICGACSILVDGSLLTGCLVPAVFVDGAEVTTVEGLAGPDATLSPLQASFIARGGLQCGICTPGQLVAATALLAENPAPSRPEIRDWMLGNLCRCTGYDQIIDSIIAASASIAGAADASGPDAASGRTPPRP